MSAVFKCDVCGQIYNPEIPAEASPRSTLIVERWQDWAPHAWHENKIDMCRSCTLQVQKFIAFMESYGRDGYTIDIHKKETEDERKTEGTD